MTRNFILVIILLLFVGIAVLFFILNKSNNTVDSLKKDAKYYNNIEKLEIEDIIVGNGEEVVKGSNAKVNYRGTLTDGTEFDSSYNTGREPYLVENVGSAQVIEGWNIGLIGMKVGGKRKLYIPSSLGYGPRAVGSIPANSTLIFEVELLEIVKQVAIEESATSETTQETSSTPVTE